MKGLKTLGIVPARAGSVRVKSKNKRLLGGKPLILHVLEEAIKSSYLDTLVVTSDDKDILEMCSRYEVEIIERPKEISDAKSQASEYVKHALKEIDSDFSHFCIIPATSPFTLAKDIDSTIKLAFEKDCESAVSVMKLDHSIHPFKLKTMQNSKLIPFLEDENGRMADFELPDIFVRNCSVYVSKLEVLKKYNQIIGKEMYGYLMPTERSIDINDERDFMFAEFMYQRNKLSN